MTKTRSLSGVIVGYDPGGAEGHGVATLVVEAGKAARLSTTTVGTTEQVIKLVERTPGLIALGIDTLTCWSTGPGGWRPADRWLRERYRSIANSVVAPNGLRGSMAVSGMALLIAIEPGQSTLFVTETHPKVLFWFLSRASYDYAGRREFMDDVLGPPHSVQALRPPTTMSGMRRCPPSQRWRACPAVGITICTPFRRVVTSAC